jgi:hypothetical protein
MAKREALRSVSETIQSSHAREAIQRRSLDRRLRSFPFIPRREN